MNILDLLEVSTHPFAFNHDTSISLFVILGEPVDNKYSVAHNSNFVNAFIPSELHPFPSRPCFSFLDCAWSDVHSAARNPRTFVVPDHPSTASYNNFVNNATVNIKSVPPMIWVPPFNPFDFPITLFYTWLGCILERITRLLHLVRDLVQFCSIVLKFSLKTSSLCHFQSHQVTIAKFSPQLEVLFSAPLTLSPSQFKKGLFHLLLACSVGATLLQIAFALGHLWKN